MSDLIDTTEMYLRTLYELQEEGIPPLRARIAERLGQSGPTVSQTVARMERDGLVRLMPDRSLELTDAGHAAAVRVMRKHRLAECLLLDVIGLPWEDVHVEACRWEHVMSEAVEQRLLELLDHPQFSPFGNPIPGLEEISAAEEAAAMAGDARPLSTLAPLDALQVRIVRIGEHVQNNPDVMTQLARAGVRPCATVSVTTHDSSFHLAGAGDNIAVPFWAAELMLVESTE